MKNVLAVVMIILLVLLGWYANARAEGTHIVQLKGVQPVEIDEAFPQTPENRSFRFMALAITDVKALKVYVIVGQSTTDQDYQMLLLFVKLDEKFYLIAASTGKVNHVTGKLDNTCHYRDLEFFSSGKFSGKLNPFLGFPNPSEVERVAPEKKVVI